VFGAEDLNVGFEVGGVETGREAAGEKGLPGGEGGHFRERNRASWRGRIFALRD